MELKENMYVRLDRNQGIARIDEIDNIWISIDTSIYDEWAEETFNIKETDILKARHNIIDLIEVGDYVNGYKITEIINGNRKCLKTEYRIGLNYVYFYFYEEDIKSILTKEQYEEMAYKVV